MLKLLKAYLPLIIILVVAAFLRLYRIADYMTFLGDEGRDVLVVYNILHGHFTLLGPTASVGGFFLGPIYYYFMTPFLWLWNYDPVGPAVMVALFGVATVALIYKVGSEFFNKRVGIISAFLYSVSPLVISYSRSSWNPNLMPFFSLFTLYILYKACAKNKSILFVVVGFMLGIMMQLHYLATFIGVIIVAYIFILNTPKYKEITKKYILLFCGFLIGWSPFIAFEIRHGFNNIKSIVSFVVHPTGKDAIVESMGFFPTISNVFFRLFGRLVANFPPPEQLDLHSKPLVVIWEIGIILFAVFSSYLLLKKTYKLFKLGNKDFDKYLLLSVWFVLGIVLFGFYRKQIYDYYFEFIFPLPFFIVANALDFMFDKKKIFLYASALILLVVIALNLDGIPFKFEPNRQLNQMRTISKFVLDKSGGKPFNFGLSSGGNSDYAYRYFFTIWQVPVITIQNPIIDPKRTTITDQLLVVCEALPCHPLGNPAWEISGFGRAQIDDLWDVSVVQVAKLSHFKEN